MKRAAALLPAIALAAALFACGADPDRPAPPVGEEQALERADAMLQERTDSTPPDTTP